MICRVVVSTVRLSPAPGLLAPAETTSTAPDGHGLYPAAGSIPS